MNRTELLENLINMRGSTDVLIGELEQFGWDAPMEFVTLKGNHLLKVLKLYLLQKLTKAEVEEWANAVESREDIGVEADLGDLINEAIYELANPYLTENLTEDRAKQLCKKLDVEA